MTTPSLAQLAHKHFGDGTPWDDLSAEDRKGWFKPADVAAVLRAAQAVAPTDGGG